MKHAVFILFATCFACEGRREYEPRNGDIVFQVSQSAQSRAIQLATNSPYSHMGIVYMRDGAPFVFEAVHTVKLTPLDEWIARGKEEHFVAKRLHDAESILSPDALRKMKEIGEGFAGRDYDEAFEWSDERLYCSELVWKVFERGAGVEIGPLEKMGDFNFSHPDVRAKIRERFDDKIPLEETVISPASMFASPTLETVYAH